VRKEEVFHIVRKKRQEGKIEGRIEVKGRGERRCKQLQDI
jgi:hypothetical protein